MDPMVTTGESCCGHRYSQETFSFHYQGKKIVEIMGLSITQALDFFQDPKIIKHLCGWEVVGLGYLAMGQLLSPLSGGKRQRITLAKQLKGTGSIYVLDEPTTGLHPSDVHKLCQLFNRLLNHGNPVIIVEHCLDVVKQADWLIDVGPDGGKDGNRLFLKERLRRWFRRVKRLRLII